MISEAIRKTKNQPLSCWLGVFGLGLFFLALRWNSFNVPLDRDEGDYAYAAQLLVQGLAPYLHLYIQKPPMVIYCYALAHLIAPNVFWFARVLACVSVASATALLGYIAGLEFGKRVAWTAMWLMTPMILLPRLEQVTGSVEMLMMLPMMGTIAIYCHSRKHGHAPRHWFMAAFLAVSALLFKYTALPMLAFTFAVWFWELQKTAERRLLWRCVAATAAGALAAAALEAGYYFIQDGGARLWECTVVFNRYYVASGPFGLTPFLSRCEIFWSDWRILFFIPLISLTARNHRIWFWFGISLCALVATGWSIYGQYYVVMTPFWALLSAVGLRALGAQLDRWGKLSAWCENLIVAFVVLWVIQTDVPWLLCSPERFAALRLEGYPSLESPLVAEQVARLTGPDDFVYVAGSEPQILYYARRFSPTRFSNVYPLMIPSPSAERYQQEAIQSLQAHPPAMIIFIQSPSSWARHPDTPPDFMNFLQESLARNYRLLGGYVNGRDFRSNLSPAEFAAARTLLYERNGHEDAGAPVPTQ